MLLALFFFILKFSFRSASSRYANKEEEGGKPTSENFFYQKQKERLFVDDAQDTKQTCRRIRLR